MNLDTLCLNCMENDSGEPICPNCGSPFGISPVNAEQLPPRTVLRGQYLIGRVLGQGSFGITYLAWDTAMETKVALKEYLPRGIAERTLGQNAVKASSPACQEQYEFGMNTFLEEARALKKLGANPNIVSVETMFRDNGTAYLVMEFLDGTSLEEFLSRRDRAMSFESAQRILGPAVDALIAVHEQGGLHGAVSPASVFLCKSGKVKLIGFGVARQAFAKKTRNQSLLKEGYAPEEQYRATGVQCPCTDIYGMAATFYRAITGKVPPPALDRLADDQLETPKQLGVVVPATAERTLINALSVRAADRCQSAEEFRKGLSGTTVPGIPLPPAPAQTSALPPPPSPKAKSAGLFTPLFLIAARLRSPKRRLVKIVALALIGLATAAAAFHYVVPTLPDDSEAANQQPADQTPAQQTPAQTDDERQRQLDEQQQQQPDSGDQQSDAGQPAEQDQQPDPTPAPPARVVRPLVAAPVVAPLPVPVAPAVPVPVPPVIAPAAPVVAPVVSMVVTGYDHLIAQADTLVQNSQYTEAAAILSRAIAANPARWQAYNALGKLQLYYMNQPGEAFTNYRAAIARGGHASFRVKHDHGGDQLGMGCSGWLNISHGSASFVADDGLHTFAFAPVKEAKKNRLIGKILGGEGGHSFHLRLMNSLNFNFVPTSGTPKEEADFIVSTIGV